MADFKVSHNAAMYWLFEIVGVLFSYQPIIFLGAMAYQGVLAYYYDQINPGVSVELDVCRWNQVVADVLWRGPEKMDHHMQCRQYPFDGIAFEKNTPENGQCHDCRVLPIEETYTVHYTACKKPWECTIPHPRVPRRKQEEYRLQHLTNITTCGLLFERYFDFRRDVERLLVEKGGLKETKYDGDFHPEYFLGYCKRAGAYEAIEPIPDDFDMRQIYGF